MAAQYLSHDGDMVDAICWHYYPKHQQALAVEEVYRTNSNLAEYGAVLPSGIMIILPELPKERTRPIINLWGQ
ncbi:tail protein X [Bartonella sp. B17]